MDVDNLTRDSTITGKILKEVDGSLVAKEPIFIHIPFRYITAKLATVGKTIYTAGVFGIVWGNRYVVCNFPGDVELTPSSIYNERINGDEYYVFGFDKGEIVIPSIDIPVDDEPAYNIFNELIGKAKLPWFVSYEDLGKCMVYTKKHSGLKLSETNAVLEIVVASIARNPDDVSDYYRNCIQKVSEQMTNPPSILPFRSVISGITNTMGKLMGSYFEEGLTSALTDEGGPAGVEDLLRL